MKRVVFANIKGGSGKTTVANELAFSLDRTGIQYSFFDLDGQRGGAHTTTQNPDAVVSIADTAAAMETTDLKELAKAADIVVIPTRHSKLDVYSFAETLGIVRETNPNAIVVVIHNGWNRYNLAKDFDAWLKVNAEDTTIMQLPQSEAISMAATQGVSVLDVNRRCSGARAILEIVSTIRECLGLEKEI